MTAYVIVDIDILDPQGYEEAKRLTPATVAAYGGRYLARGGRSESLEGVWSPKRLVVLEFESIERAKQWWDSPEYRPVKAARRSFAAVNMVVIEGIPEGF